MEINLLNNKYKVIKNYKDAIDKEELESKFTDYFIDYDYILGDIAYSKLRLKGFYNSNNKKVNKINDIKYIEDYIKQYCANDCKHFILEKIK